MATLQSYFFNYCFGIFFSTKNDIHFLKLPANKEKKLV